ncbi:nSTAND1 domain-containing NTPase [Saccharopolyspora gregorii]|uniref:nSTAND1 domain-containing NTPase n=1 Tax=Saccharopolyspora gregorii TaxID=33914 RepID=UPI0028164046|nr:trypsin-like peptidase domain-containing protein [Saccharopolyspora gregorii]
MIDGANRGWRVRPDDEHRQDPLGTALVRLRAGGEVVGAGVLLAPDRVATCAHVVAAVLDADAEAVDAPAGAVRLEFPLLPGAPEVDAEVADWRPIRPDGRGDVAILRVTGPVPAGALPAPARVTGEVWRHRFRVFGFPHGHDDGLWVTGELLGAQGTGWRQMRAGPHQPTIRPGYSGTPVWDEELRCVVGIVVTSATDSDTTAHLLPTAELGESWQAGLLNPYRGLRAFEERDAPYFHGREEDVDAVLAVLDREGRLVLAGASGAGKSSLVRAGLLPRLRARGTRIHEVRPEPGAVPDAVLAEVPADAELLFLDQFEEYVGADPAAARALLERLADQPAGGPRPVLTLRPGSLEELAGATTTTWLNECTHLLGPMTREQLRAAMTGPAAAAGGLAFEAGLVQRILSDAPPEPGSLPLVSLVLDLLWQHRVGGFLTHDAYERIGEVRGALSRTADAAFAALPARDRDATRRLLVLLTRQDGGGFARSALRWSEIPPRLHDLVRELAARRLLVIEDGPEPRVELVHQALITHWDRLDGWLRADAEFVAWQEELRGGVRRWLDSGREPELLLRGAALTTAAEHLRARPDWLTPDQQDFVRHGERHARRRSRQWWTITALAVVLALVASLLALGLHRGNRSLSERIHQINAGQLVATAREQSIPRPRVALQLALAAWHESPGDPSAWGLLLEQRAKMQGVRAVLPIPPGELRDASASADGRTVLALTPGEVGPTPLHVVRGVGRARPQVRTLPTRDVVQAELSADGELVAVADRWNAVSLWDAATGRELGVLPGPRPSVAPDLSGAGPVLRFSADGRHLLYLPSRTATPGAEVVPVLWDVARRAELPPPRIPLNAVADLFPTGDPASVVVLVPGGDVLTTSTRGAPQVVSADARANGVIGDGTRVLRCDQGGAPVVLDVATGATVRQVPGADCPLSLDRAGRYLVERGSTLLDLGTGLRYALGLVNGPVSQGRLITAFPGGGGTVTGVFLEQDALFTATLPPPLGLPDPGQVSQPLATSADGTKSAAHDEDGALLLLGRSRSDVLARGPAAGGNTEVLFSGDGSLLYETRPDRLVVYDADDLHVEQEIPLPPQEDPPPIAELGPGEVAVLNAGALLRLDPRTGQRIAVDPLPATPVPPEGAGALLARPGHPGELVLAWGDSVHLWRLDGPGGAPRTVRTIPLPGDEATGLTTSPDGAQLVISTSTRARIADLDTGRLVSEVDTLGRIAAFVPPLLVEEGSAPEVWFTPQRRAIAQPAFTDATTSSDGRSLVVRWKDQDPVRVPLDPWELVGELCRIDDHEFTAEERALLPADSHPDRPCSVLDER